MGTLICTKCSTENPADKKFCGECGAHLASGCPACGATNLPGQKYSGVCGTALPARPVSVPVSGSSASGSAPVAERRLVIGPLRRPRRVHAVRRGARRRGGARHPDPLLRPRLATSSPATAGRSRSSSATRSWPSGAPRPPRRTTPSEPSAPALDLVDAVRRLGPAIQARAGVLTGEAAVTIGADEPGHGRRRPRQHRRPPPVGRPAGSRPRRRGDACARPSRRSPSRRPATRRSRASTPRSPPGARSGSSPSAAVTAARTCPSRRSSAATRSSASSRTLFARDRPGSAATPRLDHGPGRHRQEPPRLGAREVHRRDDREPIYWHRGRSPAYGDGITFWALGEMVRRRAGLAETDDEATTRERIAATVAEHVPDRRTTGAGSSRPS